MDRSVSEQGLVSAAERAQALRGAASGAQTEYEVRHAPVIATERLRRLQWAEGTGAEHYAQIEESTFKTTIDNPLSTFSVDVDTASYTNVRRMIQQFRLLPPADAIRIEEWLHYFDYDLQEPTGADPIAVEVEVAGCPWNPAHRLARVALQGRRVSRVEVAGVNLVFSSTFRARWTILPRRRWCSRRCGRRRATCRHATPCRSSPTPAPAACCCRPLQGAPRRRSWTPLTPSRSAAAPTAKRDSPLPTRRRCGAGCLQALDRRTSLGGGAC